MSASTAMTSWCWRRHRRCGVLLLPGQGQAQGRRHRARRVAAGTTGAGEGNILVSGKEPGPELELRGCRPVPGRRCLADLAPADVLVGAPGPQSPGVGDVRGHQRLAGGHVTRLQHPDHGAVLLSRGQQHAGVS